MFRRIHEQNIRIKVYIINDFIKKFMLLFITGTYLTNICCSFLHLSALLRVTYKLSNTSKFVWKNEQIHILVSNA